MAPEAALIEPTQILMATADCFLNSGFELDIIACEGRLANTCNYVKKRKAFLKRSLKSTSCSECKYVSEKTWLRYQNDKRVRMITLGENLQNSRLAHPFLSSGIKDWDTFSYKNLPIGRYAQYVDILELGGLPLHTYLRENLGKLEDLMHLVDFLEKRLSENQYVLGIVSNIYYPHNRVFFEMLQRVGIKTLNVSKSPIRSQSVKRIEYSNDRFSFQKAIKADRDDEHFGIRCSQSELAILSEHFEESFRGKSPRVYSKSMGKHSSKELKKLLAIKETDNRKIILAIGSSDDEDLALRHTDALYAREGKKIRTQDEFIESLISVAKENEEYIFVYRPHPRMFPNHKYARTSPIVSDQISNLTRIKPSNLIIDLPSMGISVWDYAKIITAVINHRSSVGIEFLLSGIPVILYDKDSLNAYPSNLNSLVLEHHNFPKLKTFEFSENSLGARATVLRYCAYKYVRATIPYSLSAIPQSSTFVDFPNIKGLNPSRYIKESFKSIRGWLLSKIPYYRGKGIGFAVNLIGDNSVPEVDLSHKSAFLELLELNPTCIGENHSILDGSWALPSRDEETFLANFREMLFNGTAQEQ